MKLPKSRAPGPPSPPLPSSPSKRIPGAINPQMNTIPMGEAEKSHSPKSHHITTQDDVKDTIESVGPPTYGMRSDPEAPLRPSLPESCRMDSHEDLIIYDPKPTRRKPKHRHRIKHAWEGLLIYLKSRTRKLWKRPKRYAYSDGEDNPFVKTIQVAFLNADSNKEKHRYAIALFDTGNPKNLISPAFAAIFGLQFEARDGEVIVESFGGGQYISIAKIHGRFACRGNTSGSPLFFHPKFMDAEFEVSQDTEVFDIIIGSKTIYDNNIMEMRPDFAATGFRKKPPTYTKAEAKTIEEEAKRRREENDARKRALRDEKAKLEKSKHP